MKVSICSKMLLAALKSSVCERSDATIPVLKHVKLSAAEGVITMTGTDLDNSSTLPLAGTVSEAGEVLLNCKNVLGVLAGECGQVVLQSDTNDWTKLTINGCTYKLIGASVANFPQVPSLADAKPFAKLECRVLRTLLDRTSFVISSEESRYTPNGAKFETSRTAFRIIATDGHRLSATSAPHEGEDAGILVHKSAIGWLRRNLPDSGVVTISESDMTIHFVTSAGTFHARKLTGKFPQWQAVTGDAAKKSETATHVTLSDPAGVVAQIKRVIKVADERSGAGKFVINGKVQLQTQCMDVGEASVTLAAYSDHAGETDVKVGLNLSYVSDFLKLTQDGKVVRPVQMNVADAQSAVHFVPQGLDETGETWDYILMPMRI